MFAVCPLRGFCTSVGALQSTVLNLARMRAFIHSLIQQAFIECPSTAHAKSLALLWANWVLLFRFRSCHQDVELQHD